MMAKRTVEDKGLEWCQSPHATITHRGKRITIIIFVYFFEIRPSATNQKSLRAHYLQINATTSYAQQHFGSTKRIAVD